jgi:hypothetical protein
MMAAGAFPAMRFADLNASRPALVALPVSAETGGNKGYFRREQLAKDPSNINDGRPDMLQPRNLTECELRHLGGPYQAVPITSPDYGRLQTELKAEVLRVKKHCAAGTDEYLP